MLSLERTEKIMMGSIKNIVSEPIKGHERYHMLVSVLTSLAFVTLVVLHSWPLFHILLENFFRNQCKRKKY